MLRLSELTFLSFQFSILSTADAQLNISPLFAKSDRPHLHRKPNPLKPHAQKERKKRRKENKDKYPQTKKKNPRIQLKFSGFQVFPTYNLKSICKESDIHAYQRTSLE